MPGFRPLRDLRAFVTETVVPGAAAWDRDQRIPGDVIGSLAGSLRLACTLPEDVGGSGTSFEAYGRLHEELGRGCSSLRSLVTVHDMVAGAIHRWADDDLRARLLPEMISGETLGAFALTEPNVGSDAVGIEATATRGDDGWTLDGVKLWVTGGTIAGVFLVFAVTDAGPGAFLVPRDTAGLTITPISDMLGLRAAMPVRLDLERCVVPEANLVGREGYGVNLVASSALVLGRYGVACGCVGLAQAGLDEAVAHAGEREQFGQKLREHGLVQGLVADMFVNVEAARRLCRHAGRLLDERDPGAQTAVLVAKAFAAPMAARVAKDAVQILGARGCNRDATVQRLFRDAKVMEIIEGSTQILQTVLSGHAFRAGSRKRS